jgi:hypothetical protein
MTKAALLVVALNGQPQCVRWTWTGDVYNRRVVCLEWRYPEKKKEPKKKSAWRKQQIEEQRMIEDPEEEAWKEIEAKGQLYVKYAPTDILTVRNSTSTEVIRIGPEGHLFWRGREVETDDDFRGAMMDLAAAMRQNMIPPQREFNQGWNAALDSAANQVAGMFGGEDTADSFAVFFRNMKV